MAHFWSIFPIFGAKNFFLENPVLSRTTSYRFLAPHQNLEKTNATVPRKRPDRQRMEGWMEGLKDRQTLSLKTLPATAGSPKTQQKINGIHDKQNHEIMIMK